MRHLLILFTFLSFVFNSFATHVIGADISYKHISLYNYKVIYKVYRSCADLPFNGADFKVTCADGSNAVTISPTRTSIKDISEVCSKDSLPCSPQNAKSNPGIEEHIYEVDIDFSQSTYAALKTNCCQVVFSMSICCRNGAVTNISPGNFYLESMLDLCLVGAKGNTSPVFNAKPMKDICCSQAFTYNSGGVELAEGDSISYKMAIPLKNINDPETYTGNFDENVPMTPYCPPTPGTLNCKALPSAKPPRGFYFDNENGDVIFTPINCSEAGVIVFIVEEWRRDSLGVMQKIGYVKRESTWFVKQCADNNAPYFAGNSKYTVCEGNKLCFTVNVKDDIFLPKQTIADTTQLFWDSSISKASFRIVDTTAREKSAEFCWQTEIGDARSNAYSFLAIANDNNCPNPLKTFRSYQVTVKPKAKGTLNYTKGFKGKLVFEAIPNNISGYDTKNFTYQITIKDSTNAGTPLYLGFYKKDSIVFTQTGNYFVEYQFNNPPYNCPIVYTDSIYVSAADLVSIATINTARISLYPNPVTERLYISSSDLELENATVKIYSMDGKLINTYKNDFNGINVSDISAGVYTVEIITEEGIVVKKILIE